MQMSFCITSKFSLIFPDLKKLFVNSNTTDATNGVGTSYPSGAPDFIPGFQDVRFAQSLVFCVVFCRSLLCPFVVFIVAIVFSVLRITPSDYPFGILWPLYFLSFASRLLITPLVSCGHCIFCPSHYFF